MDFPTAWEIQWTADLEHREGCSSVPTPRDPMKGPGMLCDCGAVADEHRRRHRKQKAAS
jgi:hypothetical protein